MASQTEPTASIADGTSTEAQLSYHKLLSDAQKDLLLFPEYTDLEVKCKDKSWNCHHAILCSRSQFFKAACGSGFAEAESQHIDLREDDPEAVELLLIHLYTLEGPVFESFTQATKAAIISDKYNALTMTSAAVNYMVARAREEISCWPTLETDRRYHWLDAIERYGDISSDGYTFKGSVIGTFASMANAMRNQEVKRLLSIDTALSLAYCRALAILLASAPPKTREMITNPQNATMHAMTKK